MSCSPPVPPASQVAGLLMAGAGVLTFSVTFPATQEAMLSFSPWTVGIGRAAVAAALGGGCLLAWRAPLPGRRQAGQLAAVSLGVVIGFPLLVALALQHVDSSHAAVVTGLLPLATAVFGRLRGRERPGRLFWWAAAAGAAVVAAYTLRHGPGRFSGGDLLLLGGLAAGGMGYTEGGLLARQMPGWQVVSWALVFSLPVTVPVAAVSLVLSPPHRVGAAALAGLGYVSVFSMFLGFLAWYPGLARAGITRGSQIQLLQPLLTVSWAALLLGEPVTPATLAAAAGVLACVGVAQRARLTVPPAPAGLAAGVGTGGNDPPVT